MMSSLALSALAPLLSGAFIPFFFIYAFGFWQGQKGAPVPQLGSRTALSLGLTVCFQVLLLGLTLFIATLIDDGWNRTSQTSLGMVVGAAVAGGLPYMLWKGLPAVAEGAYDVGRKALGINTMISSVASTILTIVFFVMLFSGENIVSPLVAAFLYSIASAVLFLRLIGSGDSASA